MKKPGKIIFILVIVVLIAATVFSIYKSDYTQELQGRFGGSSQE